MAGNNKRPFSQHLHKTRSHNSSRSVYYATYAHNCISPLNISLILFTYRSLFNKSIKCKKWKFV